MKAEIFQLLLMNAHRLGIEAAAALVFEPVSVMGMLVVQLLARKDGPRSLRQLAGALGCSRPAVKQVVDRLRRDGLVEQRVDPSDGRGRLLCLTENGVAYGEFATEALERCIESVTVQFTDEERETLHTLLTRLERGADWHRTVRLWRHNDPYGATMPPAPAVHVR